MNEPPLPPGDAAAVLYRCMQHLRRHPDTTLLLADLDRLRVNIPIWESKAAAYDELAAALSVLLAAATTRT